jgi:aminoglycoside phosphotransferase (APT) family kinase protein
MSGAHAQATRRLSEQLRALFSDRLGQDVTIEGLHQLTGGASRQTWSFDALQTDGTRRPLILRRDPPEAPRGSVQTRPGMETEALAFEAAARAGVPEPRIVAHDDGPSWLDAPFIVMERVEGETLARRILRDEQFATVRPRLAQQCGEILARIHSIPVDQVPGLERSDVLAKLRDALAQFEDSSPALELGLRWLEEHRPPETDNVVVHGDFRNGNLVVGPDGIRAVLDWEVVHRGDPMQDLGYLCVRAWRFGAQPPVGGFGSYADLFAGYERVSHRSVDVQTVRWWELYGTTWWGVGCMRQAWRHLSGAERSVELAAIGRRVWEQEYDVLLLLEDRQAA